MPARRSRGCRSRGDRPRYDLRDALVLSGGIVLYQEGDSPGFDSIGRNDRFFLSLDYSF